MSDAEAFAECVINISEGRSRRIIDEVSAAGAETVLDVHSDPEHHRSVLTLAGRLDTVESAARHVVTAAVELIDLRAHRGIHPRFGAADVVPFVPLPAPGAPAPQAAGHPSESAWMAVLDARGRFAQWAGTTLDLPCFLYGPERSLPEVRKTAFRTLEPDTGPTRPHPTAGATAVGARPVMVAYNVWIVADSERGAADERPPVLAVARSLSADLRGPNVRSLGLAVEAGAQVSFNLIDPATVSVVDVYDAVAAGAEAAGCSVLRAELVGLVPAAMLDAIPRHRWPELDLSEDRTIETRLASCDGRPRPTS